MESTIAGIEDKLGLAVAENQKRFFAIKLLERDSKISEVLKSCLLYTSLSPYTLEEVVARNYLIGEQPDAIINIVDGTNICLLYTSRCV